MYLQEIVNYNIKKERKDRQAISYKSTGKDSKKHKQGKKISYQKKGGRGLHWHRLGMGI